MSIIYDALKKVEMSQTDDSKTKIDKGFKSKLKIYLLYASMICLGLFIANIFYGRLLPKPSLNTTDIVTGGQPPADKKIAFPPLAGSAIGVIGDNLKVRFSVVRKVLYTFLHHEKQTVSSSQPSTEPAALQTSASVETKIETQKESPPSFTLNGVFFSGAEGYALINNRIVKKGDKIDGATVIQVLLDEVDLDFGGSIIKLSNSAK
jgi:hypothetical protein